MVSHYHHDFWKGKKKPKTKQGSNYKINFRDYELPLSEKCQLLCKQLLPHPPLTPQSFLFT